MVLGLLMAVSGTYAATIDLATKTVAGEVITLANGDVLTGTASVRVQVKIAGGASITLEGVTLPGDSEGGHPGIECLGNATITLKGLNKVKAYGAGFSGVFVPFGSSLTIEESTAVRYGALEATGTNYGAGIGGDLLDIIAQGRDRDRAAQDDVSAAAGSCRGFLPTLFCHSCRGFFLPP